MAAPCPAAGSLPQFDPSLGPLNSVTYTGRLDLQSLFFFAEPQSAVNYTGTVYVLFNGEFVITGPVVSGTRLMLMASLISQPARWTLAEV